MKNDLDIQAIAEQAKKNIPEGAETSFEIVVRRASQTFCELTPSHSQEVREAWVAAATWFLSILVASMKEQPSSASDLATLAKINLSAMVVAIAADEVKANELMRERLQAAFDASESFWEE